MSSGADGVGSTPMSTSSAPRPVARPLAPGSVGRAGRRERARPGVEPSFFARYRTLILTVVAVIVAAGAVGYLFIGATQPAYACTQIFDPSPTPTIDPSSSARLGFLQDDMGNSHIVNPPQRYLFCPPASGNHYNIAGVGPIAPRVYKPDDKVGPSNWVHNLEHGGLVILYRNDSPGATAAGQQAFRDYFQGFPASPTCHVPPGSISPVIARFDDMPHPYAVLVWDRVMYLDSWDPALATRYYLTEAERLDANGELVAPPEKQCTVTPRPSVTPSGSVAPPASGAASAPASVPASTDPSAAVPSAS
jgi:uncharacterized protein DUF3105